MLTTNFPRAADFELQDHQGAAFTLHDHLSPAGAVLIFFRGHWCPYCRRYLSKIQSHLPRLTDRGASVAAICPEPPATCRGLASELGLTFPILSDIDGRVIERYGTRNGFLTTRSLLPHPSVFVIDAEGRIRFRNIDRNFKKRTPVRRILLALDELAGAE